MCLCWNFNFTTGAKEMDYIIVFSLLLLLAKISWCSLHFLHASLFILRLFSLICFCFVSLLYSITLTESISHHLLKIYSGYFDKCKSLPLNFLKHTHSYSPENLKFVFGSKQLGPQITKLLWLTLSKCKIGFSVLPASHSSFQHLWEKKPKELRVDPHRTQAHILSKNQKALHSLHTTTLSGHPGPVWGCTPNKDPVSALCRQTW